MIKVNKKYKGLLLNTLQQGKPIGNMAALENLRGKIKQLDNVEITDDEYWAIRNALIDDGKIACGRGRGGSIYLVPPNTDLEADANCDNRGKAERKLYPDILKIIEGPWALSRNHVEENSFACITAYAKVPGKWRNPDLSMVSIVGYDFIPGKTMELTTFEVKPNGGFSVEGIFETASHLVFGHRSFLMIQDKDKQRDADPNFARLLTLLPRFGVGLVLFEDPGNYATYEIIAEAEYKTPAPSAVSEFIKYSFPEDMQHKIRSLTR